MEREILFRGKNNGEWVEGFYLYDGSREEHRITRYNSLLDKMVVYNILDKETIGQYSGLKDKEGYYLHTVGDRLIDLSKEERDTLFEIYGRKIKRR